MTNHYTDVCEETIKSLRQQLAEAGKLDASEDLEQAAFEKWLYDKCPSGDVESVQRQWLESYEYAELVEKLEQAAHIEMMREALGHALNGLLYYHHAKLVKRGIDVANEALSATPDQALEQFAERVREQCAKEVEAEAIDLQLHTNRRIQELEAEKEAFYMDYRAQCDKDTKILEERIATLSRQLDSALRLQKFFEDGITALVKQENESLSFINLCALLPEDVCWGDMLTPNLMRHMLMAYTSKRHKNNEQRD